MDLAVAGDNPDLNPQSYGSHRVVGEKRPRAEENGGGLVIGEEKSLRAKENGGGLAIVEEKRTIAQEICGELVGTGEVPLAKRMGRVAEMVLVLSGLSRMRRGGNNLTEEEAELMREARVKMAEMCEELALKPWDIVGGRDAAGAVLEDLGLRNERLKELGVHHTPPKLSISEKLLVSKRKMEESRKFVAPNATYASSIENRGAPNTTRMFPSDRSSPVPMSTGGFSIPSHPVHATSTTTPSTGHLPTREVRSTISSGLPGGLLGRESISRVERPQHGGLNVYRTPSVQANSSAIHPPVTAPPAWPAQPQPASSVRARSENKVANHILVKVEGSVNLGPPGFPPQPSRDQNLRAFTTPGSVPSTTQSFQGMILPQAPSIGTTGSDIAKIVQRLLQPKVPHHPIWTPPSREYMNRPITCLTCAITINDVDSVLICDACEKGFHVKCLPNLKGIPRGSEWHCSRCLALLSNGKSLPPKYGRVMRSTSTPNTLSNAVGVQEPPVKKLRALDPKANQQILMPNENKTVGLVPNSNISNASIVQGNYLSLSGKDANQMPSSGTHHVDDSKKPLNAAFGSPIDKSAQMNQLSDSEQITASEVKPQPPTMPSTPVGHIQPQVDDSTQPLNAAFGSPIGSSSDKSAQRYQLPDSEQTPASKVKPQSPTMSSTPVGHIQPSENPQSIQTGMSNTADTEVLLKNCPDNNSDIAGNVTSGPDIGQEVHVAPASPVGNPEPITSGSDIGQEMHVAPAILVGSSEPITSGPEIGQEVHVAPLASPVGNPEPITSESNIRKEEHVAPASPVGNPEPITSGSEIGQEVHIALASPVPNPEPITSGSDIRQEVRVAPASPVGNPEPITSGPHIGQEVHVAPESPVENSEPITEAANHTSSDGLHIVEWIGDVFEVANEKKFYQSCCIDGVTYKVQNHALFRSSHDKLIPSKLQSMWVDSKTDSKWIIVKKCFIPGDLPESVARPSKPENNEVYESTNDSTLAVGLIQGLCEVLPPSKFEEVNEKRSQSQPEPNQGAFPVFLCKWQFDELKGTFQPVSS